LINQFSRSEFVFGKHGIEKIFSANIALFGIGGVGGHCAEALVRGGISKISIFDDDKICVTNINRQLVAAHSTIGKFKADVLKERLLDINPSAEITPQKIFYSPENANEIDLSQFDYVIDAIDTVTAKTELVVRAKAANVKIISSMGAANKTDITAFEVADIFSTSVCPLAKVMRKELRTRGITSLKVVYSKQTPIVPKEDTTSSCRTNCVCPPGTVRKCTVRRQIPGSNSFVPPAVGLIIAGEVLCDIASVNLKD
jgi:tRNA A37 threonylcarbamoyladenosine dehydratase